MSHRLGMTAIDFDLVVTDLDGTLWELPEATHAESIRALAELERREVPLLIATGRRTASTRDALAGIGLTPAAVVLNGVLGVDLATDEHFHRGGFDPVAAAAVLEAFALHGVDPCVYVDHHEVDVFLSPTPGTHPDHVASFGTWARTGDLTAVTAEFPILAFSVLGVDPDLLDPIAAALEGLAEHHLSAERRYGQASLTVAPPACSKWDGVLAFCTREGLDASRVLALGDGPNDLELLSSAALALVPEDGHLAALALADHVIPRAHDGGWASVIDHLG